MLTADAVVSKQCTTLQLLPPLGVHARTLLITSVCVAYCRRCWALFVTWSCRDPEQTRISAGSVVLLGLFEVLKAHTDQAEVVEAVRRCLSLMLQLMASGENCVALTLCKRH